MAVLGVKYLITTAATGALNYFYQPGQLMVIKNHINMFQLNPTDNDLDNSLNQSKKLYDSNLAQKFIEAAQSLELDCNIHQGTYVYVTGPHFETPAEVRFLRRVLFLIAH